MYIRQSWHQSQTNYKSKLAYHKQMQSLSEYTKLSAVNDMTRSFDLENKNNHKNLEKQEDNSFDYFLQSTA
jgi:hypothetical protein